MSQETYSRDQSEDLDNSEDTAEASESVEEESSVAFEPASFEVDEAQIRSQRTPIKPKLIKRDMGVRLTEVRRAHHQGRAPLAPRGTGPLAETPAVSQIRRDKAIKRATELINSISEELGIDVEEHAQHKFGAPKSLPPLKISSKVPKSKEKRGWRERLSMAPKPQPETQPPVNDQELDATPIQDHVEWSLDEETINVLSGAEEELSLGVQEPSSKHVYSPDEQAQVHSNHTVDQNNLSPDVSNEEVELAPKLFLENLRTFEGGESDRLVETSDSESSHDFSTESQPHALPVPHSTERGQIIWSREPAKEQGLGLSEHAQDDSSSESDSADTDSSGDANGGIEQLIYV